ncbi:MAG: YfhO family protein, partial [Clostridia bacterium]|nr:YfhO family protein [Clostridia bacterium]
WSQFPQQGSNGLLRLGEFKDRQVQVKINVRTATTVQDFGVLAVENSKVAEAAKNVKTIGLRAGKNKIYGSYTAEGGECVFLSVPYDSGFRLKINGKKADYYKVYDGFIGFYLQEGENRIELTYLSPGFPVAVFLTVCGTGLCAAAFVLWKHKKIRVEMPAIIDKVVYYGLIVAGVAVIAVIYVMPLLLAV